MQHIKKEVRIIAWDDAPFSRDDKSVAVVGLIFRGGSFLDGMLSCIIERDGNDSTSNISEAMLNSSHYDQLSIVMLNGITFAGFNIIDIRELFRKTKLPVIVVQRKMPDLEKFNRTLKIFPDLKQKARAQKNAGRFKSVKINNSKLYYQKHGISDDATERILRLTCIRSNIPEPLRAAHLIASGLKGAL